MPTVAVQRGLWGRGLSPLRSGGRGCVEDHLAQERSSLGGKAGAGSPRGPSLFRPKPTLLGMPAERRLQSAPSRLENPLSILPRKTQCAAVVDAVHCKGKRSALRSHMQRAAWKAPPAPLGEKRLLRAEWQGAGWVPAGRLFPKKEALFLPVQCWRREEGLLFGLHVDASGLGSGMLSVCHGRLVCRPCLGGAAQAVAGQSRTRKAPLVILSSVSGW